MTYPCVPLWMKEKPKDPFDYPLRSKKEIAFDMEILPPVFPIKLLTTTYDTSLKNSTLPILKTDKREAEIKMIFDMKTWGLTPLQKKRLIFLLGRRYKGGDNVKIVVRQFNNQEYNLSRCLDIIKQLYFETKRAPCYIWERMNSRERRKAKKVLGVTNEDKKKTLEIIAKEYEEDLKKFEKLWKEDPVGNFREAVAMPRYTQTLFKEIDKISAKNTSPQEPEQGLISEEAIYKELVGKGDIEGDSSRLKLEKLKLAKQEYEKNKLSNRILTPKAYKMFFEDNLNKKEEDK